MGHAQFSPGFLQCLALSETLVLGLVPQQGQVGVMAVMGYGVKPLFCVVCFGNDSIAVLPSGCLILFNSCIVFHQMALNPFLNPSSTAGHLERFPSCFGNAAEVNILEHTSLRAHVGNYVGKTPRNRNAEFMSS